MSPKRILIAIALMSAITAMVVLLCSTGTAQAAGLPQGTPPGQKADVCGACHADAMKDWQSGHHKTAFSDEAFKKAWVDAKNDTMCLSCHTTGFDSATGQYAEEGVTCQACHKPGPQGHPGGVISVENSSEFCGKCHTTTLHEYQKSGHGKAGIACSACHDMHSGTVKYPTTGDLCVNCHKQQNVKTDMPMTTGAKCVDCHMYSLDTNKTQGQAATGHSFIMGPEACARCHKDDIHTAHKIDTTSSPTPGTDKPIVKPEAQPAATTSQGVSGLPQLAGGALGGLFLGFVAAVFVARRNS